MIFLAGFNAMFIEIRDILTEIGDMYRFVLKSVRCPLNFWYVSLDFELIHELSRFKAFYHKRNGTVLFFSLLIKPNE